MKRKYDLPRGYLSFSSMQTWERSKDSFRRKYYSSEQYNIDTPYTRFGKGIAEILEDKEATAKHPILSKLPVYYDTPEYPVDIEVDGVPMKGYIDTYDTECHRIGEYKTGIRGKKGKAPWNDVKVRKHDQLLLYSLLIKKIHGKVDPIVKLVWMETEWAEVCEDTIFDGKVYQRSTPALQLTGHMETFERHIRLWEHDVMRQKIRRIAEEITEDYGRYKRAGQGQGDHSKSDGAPVKEAVGQDAKRKQGTRGVQKEKHSKRKKGSIKKMG